jgi:microcystin-dependent protein
MSEPFVAEIRIFPFNFAPKGWAMCNGQLLPISQNTALFSLLGTFYGGDGKSTFALPNLTAASPMQAGQGPGLSLRDLGETGGEPQVTLLQSEIPQHVHTVSANANAATVAAPANNVSLARSRGLNLFQSNTTQNIVAMSPSGLTPAGGSLPHNNLMPYMVLNFCIALQGIFPARP